MIVLEYLGNQYTKFHAAGWFFTSFYLKPCIWPDAISRWILQRNSECANLGLSCPGLSLVTTAQFTVMTLRRSYNPPNEKVQTHGDRASRNRWRAKSKACSSFSLTSMVSPTTFRNWTPWVYSLCIYYMHYMFRPLIGHHQVLTSI
jgi:hypothetical protein